MDSSPSLADLTGLGEYLVIPCIPCSNAIHETRCVLSTAIQVQSHINKQFDSF